MSGFLSRYENIVLKDVRDPRYRRRKLVFWSVYALIGIALTVVYFGVFHSVLARNVRFALIFERWAHGSGRELYQTMAFVYDSLIVFIVFAAFVGFFLLLGLLGFDLQRRNAVIRRLLGVSDNPPALKRDNS
ncbi:MAG: hypothetical protein V1798_02345 [Pseudomonadota bacterium]